MRNNQTTNAAAPKHEGRRFRAMFLLSLVALAAVMFASLSLGSSTIGATDVAAFVMGNASDMANNVLANVRVPRVLGGVLAGAALAEAGALIQATLNNPLASPNIIGVNAGSGLFVLLFACVAPHALGISAAAAFLGALASALLVFFVSAYAGASRLTIVLAGMALTAIFTAGMNTVLIFNPDAYVNSSGFLVGSLSGVMVSELAIPGIMICAGLILAMGQGTRLNILSLGDEGAACAGPERELARDSLCFRLRRCWQARRCASRGSSASWASSFRTWCAMSQDTTTDACWCSRQSWEPFWYVRATPSRARCSRRSRFPWAFAWRSLEARSSSI